jgi:coproporphyrinogen III oxidase-like Fe-S oxidoreductase
MSRMNQAFLDFFQHAPAEVDIQAIYRLWSALGTTYDVNRWRLPLPLWAQRPFDDSGAQAWKTIKTGLAKTHPEKPFCIYIHIPFCSSKCGFCDSYSFKLGRFAERRIEEYVDLLIDEVELWSIQGNLASRPVTTVHFGGGTPTFLGERQLSRLVEHCRQSFRCSQETEWALESTVESLSSEMIAAMGEMGFRRLHLGVQSLEPMVRKAIGRRFEPEMVLEKIRITRDLGWVVSVDLICGLPYQSLAGWISGFKALIAAGVNGFSLYELLVYPQNHRWAERYGLTQRDHRNNFFLFLAGAQLLGRHGYQKNMFNHWADALDLNIYFRFPTRDEDCLALGAIADGVFGCYHYRHPTYAAYLKTARAGFPGLQGGLRRNRLEQAYQPVTTALLSGSLTLSQATGLEEGLLQHWQEARLVEELPGRWQLTDSGSWFAGNLVAEVTGQIPKSIYAEG